MIIHKTISTRCCQYLSFLLPFFLLACGGGSGGGSGSDTTAPTVSSTSPDNSAAAVAKNSSLTATFDEDIFASTVDATSFTLANSAGGNVPGSVSFEGASNVATLTPDSTLAVLATYTATLSTAITDLSGNSLATNYSWSFTTADGAWGSAVLIETDNAGHAFEAEIAFDDNGNALAVWQQSDGTRSNIWVNRFDGSSWGSATLIESDNAGSAGSPQIAFDHSANALAVWEQDDGTRFNIWSNRFE